jgi:hypothetical protein
LFSDRSFKIYGVKARVGISLWKFSLISPSNLHKCPQLFYYDKMHSESFWMLFKLKVVHFFFLTRHRHGKKVLSCGQIEVPQKETDGGECEIKTFFNCIFLFMRCGRW